MSSLDPLFQHVEDIEALDARLTVVEGEVGVHSANRAVVTDGAGVITVAGALTDGMPVLGVTGGTPAAGTITAVPSQTTVTPGPHTLAIGTVQNIATTSSPTFAGETLTGLTLNRIMTTTTGGQVTTLGALADGKIPMGVTGGAPVAGSITATANQTTVTESAGGVQVGTVQNINTTSSPTFAGATLTGLTLDRVAITTTGGQITTLGALTNGKFPLGRTGLAPVVGTLSATSNQTTVTEGSGTLTIGTVQNINTTSSPTFNAMTLTTLNLPAGASGTTEAIGMYDLAGIDGVGTAITLTVSSAATGTCDVRVIRFGRAIFVYFDAAFFDATGARYIQMSALPTKFKGVKDNYQPILCTINGTTTMGAMMEYVASANSFRAERTPMITNWSNTIGTSGWFEFCMVLMADN